MEKKYDAIALFSGGLDSLLAVKTIEEQGLTVKCLHFVTPFFGKPHLIEHWRNAYNVDVDALDISERFVQMLRQPPHGYGKIFNPCIDCKILMMRETELCRQQYGVRHVISGEVLGQRPMSQRRDTLQIIRNDSLLGEYLLRPLSAKLLPPSAAEQEGLVNREKLHDIAGRGRGKQLRLAEHFGIQEIPTPAGGCKLTEKENASRYGMVFLHLPYVGATDLRLANVGRQYWTHADGSVYWLSIGRNSADNDALEALGLQTDLSFSIAEYPGPFAVARPIMAWSTPVIEDAAAFVASFSPKAVQAQVPVRVVVRQGGNIVHELQVLPLRHTALTWLTPQWENVKTRLRSRQDTHLGE